MDENGNNHSVLVNGKVRALIPAGKDVTLMVMVPGLWFAITSSSSAACTGPRNAYGHSPIQAIDP
jgi:hypothetical protein